MRFRQKLICVWATGVFLALGQPSLAQNHLYTFEGDAGDELGISVECAGDVNRDGHDDVVVGAWKAGRFDNGLVRVYSGSEGRILHEFRGDSGGDVFGFSVGGAGDVNRDGYADIVVGAKFDDDKGTSSGSVRVLSGKDGKILFTFFGDAAGDQLGFSVGGAGDVDGDGYGDVVAGAPYDDNRGYASGSARVYSGRNGRILRTFDGDSSRDLFGWSVGGAGDVDKDGFDDVIVGAHFDDKKNVDSGSAFVFSGKTGNLLHGFVGDSSGDEFGWSVAGAGDVDRDGYADLIVGAHRDDNRGNDAGTARVLSGKTGKALFTFEGLAAGDRFGYSVAGAGDVDRDGHADLVVGAVFADSRGTDSGSAFLFSGKRGRLLHVFHGDAGGDRFGHAVGTAGDANADGFADLIVGARRSANRGAKSGIARVLSGLRLSLESSKHVLSATKGGDQLLKLQVAPKHANQLYLCLGSMHGTKPGIQVGSSLIPLNADLYAAFTIANPNTVIRTSVGFVDSTGKATSTFLLPPGVLVPYDTVVFHHATVVFNPGRTAVDFVTNSVPLLVTLR